ncbi:unnamed protein product [Nippostrongylus brasiliensis]|uniref:Ig-like domain-containing protein n=1 Tax=Nippostrongylus brasiliensis TaxID=27835 RepID=A0A0N4YE10_NIPBR|nr:unnamed protein product [Nippostrongylus brasiliensis]
MPALFLFQVEVFSNRTHYVTSEGDLVVVDVTRSSFGSYKGQTEHKLECKVDAASGALFDSKSLKIRTIEPPKLRAAPDEKVAPIGSQLSIPCSPRKRAGVSPRIQWYFNGKEVSSKAGRLVVRALSHKDYGVYQCEASNEAGSTMNTIWVKEGQESG